MLFESAKLPYDSFPEKNPFACIASAQHEIHENQLPYKNESRWPDFS